MDTTDRLEQSKNVIAGFSGEFCRVLPPVIGVFISFDCSLISRYGLQLEGCLSEIIRCFRLIFLLKLGSCGNYFGTQFIVPPAAPPTPPYPLFGGFGKPS